MAKKAKKIKTEKGLRLKIVNPDSAGIDIADREIQVCVPEDRDGENNRRFGSFTCDLREICSWLHACRINTVAMEATGVYWLNLYLMLKDTGIDVVLANPLQVKNLMDKKTDEADAEWLMLMHSYGMVKPSFQPENITRKIRNLTRHRSNLLESSSTEIQHMQKAMEMMNIKLSTVISDITGKSGLAIIRAIVAGNHNPKSLSQLADGRCRASREIIAKSLEGTWEKDVLFMLNQSLQAYDFYKAQIEACNVNIEMLLMEYAAGIDTEGAEFVRTKKSIAPKNALTFDMEKYAFDIWGVNVRAVPGMNVGSILQLVGELGHDFVDKFETARKFCKWCNIVPNNKISGGKLLSSHLPKRKNPVGQIFRMCANAVKDEKTEIGNYFRRIKARNGSALAIVATAHKIARIFYTMIKNRQEYNPRLVGCDEKELLLRKIERTRKALYKLDQRLAEAS